MKKITTLFFFVLCTFLVLQSQGTMDAQSNDVSFSPQAVEKQKATISKEDVVPKFSVKDSLLTAKNLEIGATVDIYSILGAKVHTYINKGTSEQLTLKAGIYIVRTGKTSQKIII